MASSSPTVRTRHNGIHCGGTFLYDTEFKKPIVITGAQKPIDLEITDAKLNLIDSFLYASDERSQGRADCF